MSLALFILALPFAIYKALREPIWCALVAAFLYFAISEIAFYAPKAPYATAFWLLGIVTAFRYAEMKLGWARTDVSSAARTAGMAAIDSVRDALQEGLITAAADGAPPGEIRLGAMVIAEQKAYDAVMAAVPAKTAVIVRRAVETALVVATEAGEFAAMEVRSRSDGTSKGALRGAIKSRAGPIMDRTLDSVFEREISRNLTALDSSEVDHRKPFNALRPAAPSGVPQPRGPLAALAGNGGLWLHLGFLLLTGVGAIAAKHDPAVAFQKLDTVWKLLIPMVAIVCTVRTDRHFRMFTHAWLAGTGFLALVALRRWVQFGGRAGENIGGQGGESNFLAAIIVTVIPVAFGMILNDKTVWRRRAGIIAAAVFAAAIVAAGSRGGLVALLGGGAYWLLQTNRKGLALAFACAAVSSFLAFAPDSFWKRMSTILGPDEPNPFVTVRVEKSKAERLILWGLAIDIWRDRPWMGVGPGQYPAISAERTRLVDAYKGKRGLQTHNAWLQMLAEYGSVGTLVWAGAFFYSIWCLRRARRQLIGRPGYEWFGAYCLGFEAGGIASALALSFSSFQWYDYIYWHFVWGPLVLQTAVDTRRRLDWLEPRTRRSSLPPPRYGAQAANTSRQNAAPAEAGAPPVSAAKQTSR